MITDYHSRDVPLGEVDSHGRQIGVQVRSWMRIVFEGDYVLNHMAREELAPGDWYCWQPRGTRNGKISGRTSLVRYHRTEVDRQLAIEGYLIMERIKARSKAHREIEEKAHKVYEAHQGISWSARHQ